MNSKKVRFEHMYSSEDEYHKYCISCQKCFHCGKCFSHKKCQVCGTVTCKNCSQSFYILKSKNDDDYFFEQWCCNFCYHRRISDPFNSLFAFLGVYK